MQRQVVTILAFLFAKAMCAQTCTNTGQTPASAIFICGEGVYVQNAIPVCGTLSIPVPCTGGITYNNKNPIWFRFACYSSGTLGFVITPENSGENFDWQLFDKTNHNPEDVFTDPDLFLACNWSGDVGETGASADGTSLIVCGGPAQPLFSSMPSLIQGHEYLLMISHYNETQNGFQLQFNDGSANITDPVEPHLKSVRASCDGREVIVKLNTKIKCNTLAPDGSDFNIFPPVAISSATAFSCGTNSDTDSVILFLDNPLAPGNYTVYIQAGSDGNTLQDNCSRYIAEGKSIPLIVAPLQPTPFDSITKPPCKPSKLELVFSRPILCSSIAPDGSDFMITGPQSVGVTGIPINCSNNPATTVITLRLSAAIATGGTYQVQLKTGSDGNSIIDECGNQTPPTSLSLNIKDTVSAAFTYTIRTGCKRDTIYFSHNGANGVTGWQWKFDNVSVSNLQNPVQVFSAGSRHSIQLSVTNGTCSNTVTGNLILDNEVIAAFKIPNTICPSDGLVVQNKSTGSVDRWLWKFGDGNTSTAKEPAAHYFPLTGKEMFYTIWLTAISNSGCRDSVSHRVRVLGNCYITVPSAFTPDNNGLNDYLYPINALKADNLNFRVFNRFGKLVFSTKDWLKKWDGTLNGVPQPPGIYVWVLHYTHQDTGQRYELKGTTMLIR